MNALKELKSSKTKAQLLAKNLRLLLNARDISEGGLAEALSIPVMTVRRLTSGETGDPRISTLKTIADYLNVSIDSLMENNEDNHIALMKKNIPQFVPILDWETATNIKSLKEIELQFWKEWHPVITHSLSKGAFALESRPSMQPRYPAGTLFILDPDETPNDGDTILIKLDNGLSLRKAIIDLPKWQLQPIVPGSETFFYNENQHIIIGVVVLTILQNKKEK